MRRIFKTRFFVKQLKHIELSNKALKGAIEEMEAGLIDVDLGGNVYKKRIALPGRGKSGGARTLIATRENGHWFFMYVFPKSEQENISKDQLHDLQKIAKLLVVLPDLEIVKLIDCQELDEVQR